MELFSIVCASHNQWNEFNLPLWQSLRKRNPDAPLVFVDSGSTPPYPTAAVDRTTFVRTDNESHCKAINLGLVHCPISQWYLLLDNDTLVHNEIGPVLAKLADDAVYGAELRHWRFGDYAVGWCFAIPRRVLLEVGLFDELFVKILFEETDYCYRAIKRGFGVRKAEFPVTHVNGGGGSRKYNDDAELTQVNLAHFLDKHRLDWVSAK